MESFQIFSLLLCTALVLSAPNGYIDDDEQKFIDYLSKQASHQDDQQRDRKPVDELERERLAMVRQHHVINEKPKNDQKYHLIRKSAVAIVQRLSMPSPPELDVLIDKAVHYVMKKTMVREYAQIRSGIKELVDKMLHRNLGNEGEDHLESRNGNSPTSTGLREERIVLAMEEIIQELAIRLKLTTSQTKKIVDISINKVLAKHLDLNRFQREELHERVTSQVRKMLDIEDEDNKDARLRRLEEKIEKDIEKYKLSANQVKRIEQLMVEEEAIEEGLTKEERARMLKRVYADVIDDLRTQITEEKIKPPNLNDVQLRAVNQLIRQKAIELQLNKEEIKVLGLAILTAVEHLSRSMEPTQGPHTEDIATGIPTTIRRQLPSTMNGKTTDQKNVESKSVDELRKEEEELENEKPTKRVNLHGTPTTHAQKTSQRTPNTHAQTEPKTTERTTATTLAHKTEEKTTQMVLSTHVHETLTETTHQTPTPFVNETKPTGQRSPVKEETDLDAKLLQDEAELEGKDNSKVGEESKAEELELILERKFHDKKKAKTNTSKSSSVIIKHPEVVTKPTESPVTHRVTQVTEIGTEKTKPTNKKTEKVTESVTEKVASVTQSELSRKRQEEELLGEHFPELSQSHVTQHNTEHVTAFKPTEDLVKELKNIIESKPIIHSRKNHELLQDELEMEDLRTQKDDKKEDTSLEDELKLAANLFKQKQTTLDEELNEVFKTKNRELKKLEDELEDLSPW